MRNVVTGVSFEWAVTQASPRASLAAARVEGPANGVRAGEIEALALGAVDAARVELGLGDRDAPVIGASG